MQDHIKTHGRMSAAKKAVWRTSVLFTGTAKSPFSTTHTSITTGPISIRLRYCMPSIYAIPSLKEIGPTVHKICVHENCQIFFTFFFLFFFAPFYKSNFEPTKDSLLMDQFLSILAHLQGNLWPILA